VKFRRGRLPLAGEVLLWQLSVCPRNTEAILNSIDRVDMEPEAARHMANHVLNFFGFNDTIIDNILEPEDRDAFYMLEDLGLLQTEREETTLYDGREWRIHYWMFKKDKIYDLVKDDDETRTPDGEVDVYAEVPDDIWTRSQQ
jgi:hypothetical protein